MEANYRFPLNDIFTVLASFLVCFIGVGSKKEHMDKRIKMNGYQAKPKAAKVTFEDEVTQLETETSEPSETPLPDEVPVDQSDEDEDQSSSDSESDSGSESSETDTSTDEDEREERAASINENLDLVLNRDTADLMLSYLDIMNLRMLHTECTSAHLLKKQVAGAQARLDEAKRMLDNIPETMSHTERKVHMLEISKYVESIFSTLEKLSIKLVKCHGDCVCDIILEFDDNVKNIEEEVPKPVKHRADADKEKALRIMEVSVLFAFLVLTAFTGYLLTQPQIGTAVGGFVLGVLNGTGNATDKNLRPTSESNSSGMDSLG